MSADAHHLEADHHPEAIRTRLDSDYVHSYLGDAVLGAMDGCVTTFAVVAGAVGAGFPGFVAIIMGMANLVADGFSMAVGNYQATKSQRELVDKARAMEERHIEEIPDGEREEIRQIFALKGFEGEVLEQIVQVITSDRSLWVETMLREELGLQVEGANPLRAAVATFVAFLAVGFLPLLPFLIRPLGPQLAFGLSSFVTALAFFGVGVLKGRETDRSQVKSGLETLLTGGAAAVLSYVVASLLQGVFGTY
jgi:VIT1/CCC1 family predicted Fe2+/Mn2+ transporter